ncbi:hypothetical protein AB664_08500 [Brucella anthropi]|uniref:Uncharacterized protein n=1 Tax=Brucella anthropi TaxID=529 RepID=A0A656Z7N4_BRUAN|nr:hypothetical protein AB664_08500 [Brucella anthropi]
MLHFTTREKLTKGSQKAGEAPDSYKEFDSYRADFVGADVDPRATETMSSYQIVSTNLALQKMEQKQMRQVTDEDWEEA